MKKMLLFSLSVLIVMSSCGSYEASGAATGAHFGSIIGSAIGGITGGWRGSDIGTLVGMAGGAVVGAAIGKAADEKAEKQAVEYARIRREQRQYNYADSGESGYDPQGRGDDRIMIDGMPGDDNVPAKLEISNARLLDASRDGCLTRGETARVVFEIRNLSEKPVYNVQPSVTELTGNRHIHISQNVLVENIEPHQTIRYTAQVKADSGLRNGEAVIRVSVFLNNHELSSQTRDYRITTMKRP